MFFDTKINWSTCTLYASWIPIDNSNPISSRSSRYWSSHSAFRSRGYFDRMPLGNLARFTCLWLPRTLTFVLTDVYLYRSYWYGSDYVSVARRNYAGWSTLIFWDRKPPDEPWQSAAIITKLVLPFLDLLFIGFCLFRWTSTFPIFESCECPIMIPVVIVLAFLFLGMFLLLTIDLLLLIYSSLLRYSASLIVEFFDNFSHSLFQEKLQTIEVRTVFGASEMIKNRSYVVLEMTGDWTRPIDSNFRQNCFKSGFVAFRIQKCSIIKFWEQNRKVWNRNSKELFSDWKKIKNSQSYSLNSSTVKKLQNPYFRILTKSPLQNLHILWRKRGNFKLL